MSSYNTNSFSPSFTAKPVRCRFKAGNHPNYLTNNTNSVRNRSVCRKGFSTFLPLKEGFNRGIHITSHFHILFAAYNVAMGSGCHVGIDIGNTYCRCAVRMPDNQVILLPLEDDRDDAYDNCLLRSAICYSSKGEKIIGRRALRHFGEMGKRNVITYFKQLFGCTFNSSVVKKASTVCVANVVNCCGKAGYYIPSLGRNVLPEEVYTEFIKKIYECVKRFASSNKVEVESVTITVPVTYSFLQRALVIQCARNADIQSTIRTITEPIAATAACHILDNSLGKIIVLYDIGGGAFDLSISRICHERHIELINTAGDSQIGGSLFDSTIQEYADRQFQDDNNGDDNDGDSNGDNDGHNTLIPNALQDSDNGMRFRAFHAFRQSCIDAKHTLSDSNESCEIDLSNVQKLLSPAYEDNISLVLSYPISPEEFNELIEKYIDKTIDITKKCIEKSNLTINQIDHIIVIGGSSKIPLIQSKIEEVFKYSNISYQTNNDFCVAQGACTFAKYDFSIRKQSNYMPTSILSSIYGYYDVLIPEGSDCPFKGQRKYNLSRDNLGALYISLYKQNPSHSDKKIEISTITIRDDNLMEKEHIVTLSYSVDARYCLSIAISIGNERKVATRYSL